MDTLIRVGCVNLEIMKFEWIDQAVMLIVVANLKFAYAFVLQAALKPQKAAPQAKKKEILGEMV